MNDNEPVFVAGSIAKTPKNGDWYAVNKTKNISTFIRWRQSAWDYMIMKDDKPIDSGSFEDGAEIIK